MSVVPQWVVGRFVTALASVSATVDATTGVVSLGSSTPLTARLEEIDLQLTNGTSVIVPLDVRQDNEIIWGSGFQLSLTELLSPTSPGPILAALAFAYDYAQFTFARAGKTWTILGVIKSYGETLRRDSGKSPLVIGPAGIAPGYA